MTIEEKCIFFRDKGFKYDHITGYIISHKNHVIKTKKLHIRGGYTYDKDLDKLITKNNKISSERQQYIRMVIKHDDKNVNLLGHIFAWWCYYNEIPTGILDHINQDKQDNRICNLRLSDEFKNKWNLAGIKGYSKIKNKYYARISYYNKTIKLGTFNTPEEAHQAYLDAKKIYHII